MKPLSVTWSGFRGFRRPTSLFFPGITLLIGRNNVGKTSAYAPLLLLRQTLDARNPRTALLSRGQLIDAGPYRDFVSDHDTSRAVSFTVGIPGGADVQVGRRTESAPPGMPTVKLTALDVSWSLTKSRYGPASMSWPRLSRAVLGFRASRV